MMTTHEFQRLQAVARMKNSDVQRMFGVSDQTVVNWRKGYTRIPVSVQTLIRQAADRAGV